MRDLIDAGPAKGCSGIYLSSLSSRYMPAVRSYVMNEWNESVYGQLHIINLPGLGHTGNSWKCIAWAQGHKCFRLCVFQLLQVELTIFTIESQKQTSNLTLTQCSLTRHFQDCRLVTKQLWHFLSLIAFCPCLSPGAIHLQFHSSGNHYVWRKVTSTVHNIIVGKLWIDQVSLWETLIGNHSSTAPNAQPCIQGRFGNYFQYTLFIYCLKWSLHPDSNK